MTGMDGWRDSYFDRLTTAIIVLDHRFHVVDCNGAASALFSIGNYSQHERRSQFLNICPDELSTTLKKMRKSPKNCSERALLLDTQSKPSKRFDAFIQPLDDNKILIECIEIDWHWEMARSQSLYQQQNASGEWLKGLAHEIKNPLAGIRGAAQLISRNPDPKKKAQYCDVIVTEVDRLAGLADRMGQTQLPLSKSLQNVHLAFERIYPLLSAEKDESTQLIRDYDPSIPDTMIYLDRIIQALLNLGRNALQAGASRVILRTSIGRNCTIGPIKHRMVIKLEVEDNGVGIPEDRLDSIFFPMVTTRVGGTGLGLSLAQVVAKEHGGLLQCEPNPGSTRFKLLLPIHS